MSYRSQLKCAKICDGSVGFGGLVVKKLGLGLGEGGEIRNENAK